jgi:O-antigen ligase
MVFMSHKLLWKSLAIIIFVMNIVATILSYSRGAAVVLTVVLFFLFVGHIRKFKPIYLGFVALLISTIVLMIIFLIPFSYWERQKSVTHTKTDSAIGRRVSYLYVGWEAFKERPVIGSGLGTFRDIYANSSYARQFEIRGRTNRRPAHNTYIEVIIGTGILGLLIFITIIVLTFKNFHNAKKRFHLLGEKGMVSLIGAYRISFISIIAYSFLLSGPYKKYLWISLALSQVALTLSQETSEKNNENIDYNK